MRHCNSCVTPFSPAARWTRIRLTRDFLFFCLKTWTDGWMRGAGVFASRNSGGIEGAEGEGACGSSRGWDGGAERSRQDLWLRCVQRSRRQRSERVPQEARAWWQRGASISTKNTHRPATFQNWYNKNLILSIIYVCHRKGKIILTTMVIAFLCFSLNKHLAECTLGEILLSKNFL